MNDERFVRPPEIAAALATLPDEDDPDYLNQLEATKFFEVLITARRIASTEALQRRINDIVAERVLGAIDGAAVRWWGEVPPGPWDDVKGEARAMFWEAIQEESFFEIRFNSAMKNLARQAGQRIRGRKKFVPVDLLGAMDDDVPSPHDEYAAAQHRMDLQQAIESLPDDQRRAYELHHEMGCPIFSKDPTVLTVASALGCAERKARQIWADTKAALEPWLETGGA